MPDRTSTQRLVAALLLDDLDNFVTRRRDDGKSWRAISRDLSRATDGSVTVSHETLRSWYGTESAVA